MSGDFDECVISVEYITFHVNFAVSLDPLGLVCINIHLNIMLLESHLESGFYTKVVHIPTLNIVPATVVPVKSVEIGGGLTDMISAPHARCSLQAYVKKKKPLGRLLATMFKNT